MVHLRVGPNPLLLAALLPQVRNPEQVLRHRHPHIQHAVQRGQRIFQRLQVCVDHGGRSQHHHAIGSVAEVAPQVCQDLVHSCMQEPVLVQRIPIR